MDRPPPDAGSWTEEGGLEMGTEAAAASSFRATPALEILAERLAQEMAFAWEAGERLPAEELLALHPEVSDESAVGIRLIYEEVCQRQERGEETTADEFVRRFPRWRNELLALLASHRALDQWRAAPRWPQPGRTIGDFTLLDELGRGGRGRVFVAVQPLLAQRPVVLKLTPTEDTEHLTLARLQHTHIVPLYSIEDFPGDGLRGLCMPYLGGVTLERLLDEWRDRPPHRRAGVDFVEALDAAEASAAVTLPRRGPARRYLARSTYVEAVCWIGAALAEALQYAHENDLLHLDLKPSNVLLAGDGQPMLLDFHLARGPIAPGLSAPGLLGGTVSAMAPEQREALAAVVLGRPIPTPVDGRADLYSLGLLLYEMLGGPPAANPRPRLRTLNPRVSGGLSDLVEKCLAPRARDRYPDAASLAADLRRHLADLPLRGVANRNPLERWSKWRRRRPHAARTAAALLAVAAMFLTVGTVAMRRAGVGLREVEKGLAQGRDQTNRHQYHDAVQTLQRSFTAARGLPGSRSLSLQLDKALRTARAAEAAQDLERIADRARYYFDLDATPKAELRALADSCRAVWEKRGRITQLGADLGAVERRKIRENLTDVVVLLAELDVRLAPRSRADRAHREALGLLDEMGRETGPSFALALERLALAGARTTSLVPVTAREHEALGRFLFRNGDLPGASAAFDRAIDLEPNALWPNFSQGLCAYRAGRYRDAATSFRMCIALAPDAVPCYLNRAAALLALGEFDRALRDYDRALQIDPGHAEAFLNRGLLHLRQGRAAEAVADIDRALAAGGDPDSVYYHRALAEQDLGDALATIADLMHALRIDPRHRKAREALDRIRDPGPTATRASSEPRPQSPSPRPGDRDRGTHLAR